MKKLSKLLLIIVFATLTVGFEWTEDDPGPLWNTPTVKFTFDDAYTPLGIILIQIEMEVQDSDGAVVLTEEQTNEEGLTPVDDKFSFSVREYVQPLPNGLYSARLRVVDRNGNVSGWTPFFYFNKQWGTLDPPGGCALTR